MRCLLDGPLQVLQRPLGGRHGHHQLGGLLLNHGDVIQDSLVEGVQVQRLEDIVHVSAE